MVRYLPLVFFFMLIASSCGTLKIEKRHFRKGFHISWNKTRLHNSKNEHTQEINSASSIDVNKPVYTSNEPARAKIDTKANQIHKQNPIVEHQKPNNQLVAKVKMEKFESPIKLQVETINSNRINVDSFKYPKVNPYLVGFGIAFIALLVALLVFLYITKNIGGIFPVLLLLIPSIFLLTMYTDGTQHGLRKSLLVIGILYLALGLLSLLLGASGWFDILFLIMGGLLVLLGITYIILRFFVGR